MPEPTPSRRPGGRAHRAAARAGATTLATALATVLATVLAAALVSGCAAGDGAHQSENPSANVSAVSALPPSVPDHVTVPSLHIDAPLDAVGLDPRGVMREPDFAEPQNAAWYQDGPTPGEPGAAAIVGHMDTPQAPQAVFFHLKDLAKGGEIDVHRTDGTTAVFTVDAVDTFKKDDFPTSKVYGDTGGRAELRLITCGGDLTADRHWDSNVVVFAHLTGKA
ncbi:class F sortase [Streptomyces sp. NPDC029721]|uniref:class F sortase n=1 Tax=Streptomyces sp. NPDC029721 TaxID=3157090 RepID=UPI0033D78178